MKKKKICCSALLSGILLFAACETQTVINPPHVDVTVNVTEAGITQQPECTPTISVVEEMPEATLLPTTLPEVTPEPVLTEAPVVTPVPVLTKVPEATKPVFTLTPVPTFVQEEQVTLTVTPTMTPTATPTPVPTLIPTPSIDPQLIVNNGWQKAISPDEKYSIVFPDLFRDSYVSKSERELFLGYSSEEDKEIEFGIYYKMKKSIQKEIDIILSQGGSTTQYAADDTGVFYRFEKSGRVYRGILLEIRYSKELLGNAFGEEEWINGVMEVVFSYPESMSEVYETENYNFYVVKNGEE